MPTSTNAISGIGCRLYDSPDGVTYTEVVDLMDLGSPDDPEVEMIEITPVAPYNQRREYLAGLIKNGDFDFTPFYTAAKFSHLKGQLGAKVFYRVVLPDPVTTNGSKYEFVGIMKKVKKKGLANKDPLAIECKAEVVGLPVFTPAT